MLRVPYPIGFYAKGLDGRIDDPKAGWKGKGLWSTISTRTPFHMEAARARRARWSSSSSGPIRWPSNATDNTDHTARTRPPS